MLGRTLVTKQTGPSGMQVNRVYIEDGADIARELYLAILVDRQTSRISFVVSTEGGMDIEEVAHSTPDKILTLSVDPATGYQAYHGRRIASGRVSATSSMSMPPSVEKRTRGLRDATSRRIAA